MKTKRSWLMFLAVLSSALCAQDTPPIPDISALPVEAATQIIHRYNPGKETRAFVSQALNSRRMDLIALCFASGRTGGVFLDSISQLPSSEFKDRIIVMMLKSPVDAWWPSDIPYGSGTSNWMREPFESVIRKYLPNLLVSDLSVNDQILETRAGRQKVGFAIERVMNAEKPEPVQTPEVKAPPEPVRSTEAPSLTQVPVLTPRPIVKAPVSSVTDKVVAENKLTLWLWVAGVSAFVVLVVAILKRRWGNGGNWGQVGTGVRRQKRNRNTH